MKYDDLINIWNESNSDLDNHIKINRQLAKEVSLSKIRSGLYEIKWTAYFELIVGILWTIFLIGFLIDHFGELKYALPAFALLLISVYSIALEGVKLKLYYRLSSINSIVQTQKQLARLRYLENFDTVSLWVVIPLFSAPFFIVIAKAFLGLDIYFLGNLLLYYTMGSIVIAGILVFFLSKFPNNQLAESIAYLNELKEE